MLELAAGPGDTGFDVAELLGARGRLISSDLSPAMLDVARRRGRERGIDNVDHRILDAERIALPDDAVDAVVCRSATWSWTIRRPRSPRPGACCAPAGAWRSPSSAHPTATRSSGSWALRSSRPAACRRPDPSGPGPFSMAGEGRTERLLADAGFADVRLEQVAVTFTVRDVEDYVAIHTDTSGPMALVLSALDAGERRALTERLRPALAPFRTATGCALPGVTVCAVRGDGAPGRSGTQPAWTRIIQSCSSSVAMTPCSTSAVTGSRSSTGAARSRTAPTASVRRRVSAATRRGRRSDRRAAA